MVENSVLANGNNHSYKSVSESEILAMYEDILPLIFNNPKGLNVISNINKRLLGFVHYDFLHYLMKEDRPEAAHDKLTVLYEKWNGFNEPGDAFSVSITPSDDAKKSGRWKDDFERDVEITFNKAIELRKLKKPEEISYDYIRIESEVNPRIVIGFFRAIGPSRLGAFTLEEKEKINLLTPNVLLLFQTALSFALNTKPIDYFYNFVKIGSRIAAEHDLSEAETKLLPDILFGYSNEEIAERHFVSPATVKTHINHIFKKTETKNRVDFISKFFTSPEHVQL